LARAMLARISSDPIRRRYSMAMGAWSPLHA
jgi:hypothetical protein